MNVKILPAHCLLAVMKSFIHFITAAIILNYFNLNVLYVVMILLSRYNECQRMSALNIHERIRCFLLFFFLPGNVFVVDLFLGTIQSFLNFLSTNINRSQFDGYGVCAWKVDLRNFQGSDCQFRYQHLTGLKLCFCFLSIGKMFNIFTGSTQFLPLTVQVLVSSYRISTQFFSNNVNSNTHEKILSWILVELLE